MFNNTIIIVDDEPAILDTYRQYLSDLQPKRVIRSSRSKRTHEILSEINEAESEFNVLFALSGEEALELVEHEIEQGRRVAAGFFDMVMPGGIDGLETIKRIRALDKDILCTVVTAYQDYSIEEIRKQFKDGHEDEWDYVNKPFTKAEIRQKARNCVWSWNRRRKDEEQRLGLEELIAHISQIKKLDEAGLQSIYEYVLYQLVYFTGASGGYITTIEPDIAVRIVTGDFHTKEDVNQLLKMSDYQIMFSHAVTTNDIMIEGIDWIIPFSCQRAKKIVVGLHVQEHFQFKRSLIKVFVESAIAAIDNQQMYEDLRELNTTLEERIDNRTTELNNANLELVLKTKELQHMLNNLQDAQKQIIQNEKLAAIGQLAAGVAHEINNPSTYIIANLEELKDAAPYISELYTKAITSSDDIASWAQDNHLEEYIGELNGYLDECLGGVWRIVKIVQELRAYSRVDSEESTIFGVEPLIKRSLRILDNVIRHRATIDFAYDAEHMVKGNGSRLMQVFINIINNAIQAFTKDSPEQNHIHILTKTKGQNLFVEIHDNGPGMPEAMKEKVFEPFFTTKPPGEGTGLGLAISQDIIIQHHGRIFLNSEVGNGTSFYVQLPVVEDFDELQMNYKESDEDHNAHNTKLSLLMIDDDLKVLKSNEKRFKEHFNLDTADKGEQAINKLASGTHYDVILCDLMMPNVSGVEIYRFVEEERPELLDVFYFMTGGVFTTQAREFIDQVQPQIIQKPFHFDQLLEILLGSAS